MSEIIQEKNNKECKIVKNNKINIIMVDESTCTCVYLTTGG